METTTLVRLALPAGILAAVVGVPSDLYHLTIDSRAAEVDTTAFMLHGIGLVSALVLITLSLAGLVLAAGPRLGLPGRLFAGFAYVGTLLVLGNVATEAFMMRLAPEELSDPTGYSLVVIVVSFGLFAAGWFGVALASGRHGVISPPAVLTLCLGALYGFTPFPGSYTLLLIGIAAAVISMSRRADEAGTAGASRPARAPEDRVAQ